MYASAVQRREVDAHGCPVLPKNLASVDAAGVDGVPPQSAAGDESGRIACGVDLLVVVVKDFEGKLRKLGAVIERVDADYDEQKFKFRAVN